MKRLLPLFLVVCGAAFAQGNTQPNPSQPSTPAAQMDMSKMGPWTRKPKDEGAVKKEVNQFFSEEEQLMKKGDFNAMLARLDFPVYMVTDDTSGKVESSLFNKEQYTALMKPSYESMSKDMKMTHKPTITVLSDSIATVVDEFTMTVGKQKYSGKSSSLLVKKDGSWKWKVMSEAGWGAMAPPQGTGGSGQSKPSQGY